MHDEQAIDGPDSGADGKRADSHSQMLTPSARSTPNSTPESATTLPTEMPREITGRSATAP